MKKTSQVSGFYKLSPKERINYVKDFADLTDEEVKILQSTGSLELELADRMIENVVGTFPLPLGWLQQPPTPRRWHEKREDSSPAAPTLS